MSIEKELKKYKAMITAKEHTNQPLADKPVADSMLCGGEEFTYINISLLMRKDLLEDINLMSERMEMPPCYTLSLVLHELVNNGLMLTPIEPIYTIDENNELLDCEDDVVDDNIEIDAHYLLHNIGEFNDH